MKRSRKGAPIRGESYPGGSDPAVPHPARRSAIIPLLALLVMMPGTLVWAHSGEASSRNTDATAESVETAEPEVDVTQRAASDNRAGGLIQADLPWWGWSLLLFGFTLVLGVLAVIAGVGGGVLFVPIVSALFPFHLDFVRGAGLMVALAGALSAAPTLLKQRLASLRLAMPFALVASVGAIAGATVGLAVSTEVVETALGVAILGIVLVMLRARRSDFPEVRRPDALSQALAIHGVYWEVHGRREVAWQIHRMPIGLLAYVGIGFLGGIFGLGAGWANVPALNLLLGAPVKTAVASSGLVMTINSSAGTWVYLNNGAVLPLVAVPSVAGMMLGTRVGALLLGQVRPQVVRVVVIVILLAAGLRSLLAGVGLM